MVPRESDNPRLILAHQLQRVANDQEAEKPEDPSPPSPCASIRHCSATISEGPRPRPEASENPACD